MQLLEGKEDDYQQYIRLHPHGKALHRFAEHWADIMEEHIHKGARLEAVAESCARIALAGKNISAFRYGATVALLAKYWRHGERLRVWHNMHVAEHANKRGRIISDVI